MSTVLIVFGLALSLVTLVLVVVVRVTRLAFLGSDFRNLVPNNTCCLQNFRLAFWLFLA